MDDSLLENILSVPPFLLNSDINHFHQRFGKYLPELDKLSKDGKEKGNIGQKITKIFRRSKSGLKVHLSGYQPRRCAAFFRRIFFALHPISNPSKIDKIGIKNKERTKTYQHR